MTIKAPTSTTRPAAARGQLTLRIESRAGLVWLVDRAHEPQADKSAAAATSSSRTDVVTLDPVPPSAGGTDSVAISGQAPGAEAVQAVIDGKLDEAFTAPVAADGRWRATLDTQPLSDRVPHRVVVLRAHSGAASEAQTLRLHPAWTPRADVTDPAGDDRGPSGRYTYPTDPAWRDAGPLDLRRVRVWTSGSQLKIALTMNQLVAYWNPLNGFDHAAFTLFVQLPGVAGGATAMPGQHGQLPDGMRWHLRLRANGGTDALFGWQRASDTQEGSPLTVATQIDVDAASNTVSFTLPVSSPSLARRPAGLKLYVSTWDYDGGFRALAAEPRDTTFGGGTADAPRVMDDALITLQ